MTLNSGDFKAQSKEKIMMRIGKTVVMGLMSGACALSASAGWLDAVTKAVDTVNRVTNAVARAESASPAPAETKQAEPAQQAKTEAKQEEACKTCKACKTSKTSRLALSEEEAEDIANGQPISMDMDDLAARMKASSDYVLIDVRKPAEFKSGHIKGAKNVPFDDVSNSMPKPCADKDKPVYLYCLSGDRAIAAGQYLIKNGYKRVYNCGGIDDWSGKLVK